MVDKPVSKTLSEIAKHLNGKVLGDGNITIAGVSGLREARDGDLSFLANSRYSGLLCDTKASAVIISEESVDAVRDKISAIIVKNPDLAFAKVVELFTPSSIKPHKGVHPTAVVGNGVKIGKDISIGAYSVIEDCVVIDDGSVIYPNVYIGFSARIGSDCLIYPRVVVRERVEIGNRVIIHSGSVIGSDGFGYALLNGIHHKIPQIGSVLIEDDVEIGANVTIDRARFDRTVIRKGTKIDNLVQIAHNVVIGENSVIAAQCGIAGSTRIGKNAKLGGQVGIVGHINIGDNVTIAAQAGVSKDVQSNSVISGAPAKPHKQQLREWASLRKLPELINDMKALKEQIEALKSSIDEITKPSKHSVF